jgi:aerobic-type carbon monoxide dehydrogenase small subunit (CoxS/CutS family)
VDLPKGEAQHQVQVTINGQAHRWSVSPRRTLLQALREELNLTGTKEGCGVGTCGACTILFDGRAVLSCMLLVVQVDGRQVETIEALSGRDDPLIAAFIRHDALQCGFCTPGQIITLRALLAEHPAASRDQIQRAVEGHVCRCGAHRRIVAAAVDVAGGSPA